MKLLGGGLSGGGGQVDKFIRWTALLSLQDHDRRVLRFMGSTTYD